MNNLTLEKKKPRFSGCWARYRLLGNCLLFSIFLNFLLINAFHVIIPSNTNLNKKKDENITAVFRAVIIRKPEKVKKPVAKKMVQPRKTTVKPADPEKRVLSVNRQAERPLPRIHESLYRENPYRNEIPEIPLRADTIENEAVHITESVENMHQPEIPAITRQAGPVRMPMNSLSLPIAEMKTVSHSRKNEPEKAEPESPARINIRNSPEKYGKAFVATVPKAEPEKIMVTRQENSGLNGEDEKSLTVQRKGAGVSSGTAVEHAKPAPDGGKGKAAALTGGNARRSAKKAGAGAVKREEKPVQSTVSGESLARFRSMVESRIQQSKYYPPRAQTEGQEGSVTLSVMVGPSGGIESLEVVRSSGYAVLDDSAVDSARSCGPFLPFPEGMRESIRVRITVDYVLY